MSEFNQPRTSRSQMPANRSCNENAGTRDAFERANAEIAAIVYEGSQTERHGKLDETAKKQIEARLQAISERLDRQVAHNLANIRATSATRPHAAWEKGVAIVLLLAFIGMPLEFTVGERFVFSYSDAYKSALPTLFALTLPAFAILWLRQEKQHHALSYRYPTWGVRWLIMFPFIVVFSSSLLVLSPFGWSALGGWAIGTAAPPRQARVLSVDPEKVRAGKCDQNAMLDFNGVQTSICIENRVVGPALKAGDTVSVRGRSSFLGLFIEEIRVVRAS